MAGDDNKEKPLSPAPLLSRSPAPLLLALACLLAAGCRQGIDTSYGRGKTSNGSKSINGTGVLQTMFERAGHRVGSRSKLTPRLSERADCIVWFPDDFQPPRMQTRQWFEGWLDTDPGRTLIYVGRDYDAAESYLSKILPGAPAGQAPLIKKRLSEAKADFQTSRTAMPIEKNCEWFAVDGKNRPRKVRTLTGDWSGDIDPAKLEIELNGRLEASPFAEVLLESEGDVLVSRGERDQIIVVVNGSFLLNLPLVNHEHRKLAGKLIDEVGPVPQDVVFIESRAGGPPIYDEDPAARSPTGMEIFSIFPANWILLQLAVAGIIFCFSKVPIFGRPRTLEAEGASDFGLHLSAMAELLQRSGNQTYARTRLRHCQRIMKGE